MSATRFEQTLGLTIPNRQLRLAVCRHKSVLETSASHAKYGYAQDTLAIFGDKLVNEAAKKAQNSEVFEKLPTNRLDSNEYMYHYVHDRGLAGFLQIQPQRNWTQKRHHHEYGTYFEAIVAAVYYCHGFGVMNRWLKSYFTDIALLAYFDWAEKKSGKRQAYRNLEHAQRTLDTPGKAYYLLKSVVEEYFDETISIVLLNPHAQDRVKVRLEFSLPDLTGSKSKTYSFQAAGVSAKQALEGSAKRALRQIETLYVNYARAFESTTHRSQAEAQIQRLRVLSK